MTADSDTCISEKLQCVSVDVAIEKSEWIDIWDQEETIEYYIKRVATIVFDYVGLLVHNSQAEVSMLLTCDDKLQQLNKEFLQSNYPTNVLSFPAQELNPCQISKLASSKMLFLGDIAISYQRIVDESLTQAKTFKEHFTHILVHALLHLLGYDHIKDEDAEIMERTEVAILKTMGYQDPYSMESITDTLPIRF